MQDDALTARAESAESLRRRPRTDYLDLYQLHAVTTPDELQANIALGGAVEAGFEAQREGHVRLVGISGHFLQAPQVFVGALQTLDLDTVMFPVDAAYGADPAYRRDAGDLLARCGERDLGVMAIKALARRPRRVPCGTTPGMSRSRTRSRSSSGWTLPFPSVSRPSLPPGTVGCSAWRCTLQSTGVRCLKLNRRQPVNSRAGEAERAYSVRTTAVGGTANRAVRVSGAYVFPIRTGWSRVYQRRRTVELGVVTAPVREVSPRFLSEDERVRIGERHAAGAGIGEIDRELVRAASTVSREPHGDVGGKSGGYRPFIAQQQAAGRRARPGRGRTVADAVLREFVESRLERRWSPERVAQALRAAFPEDPTRHLRAKSIYQTVYRAELGGLCRQLPSPVLRSRRRRRRPRVRPDARPGTLTNMRTVSERPAEANDRAVAGHWEGDRATRGRTSGVNPPWRGRMSKGYVGRVPGAV